MYYKRKSKDFYDIYYSFIQKMKKYVISKGGELTHYEENKHNLLTITTVAGKCEIFLPSMRTFKAFLVFIKFEHADKARELDENVLETGELTWSYPYRGINLNMDFVVVKFNKDFKKFLLNNGVKVK